MSEVRETEVSVTLLSKEEINERAQEEIKKQAEAAADDFFAQG